MLYGLDITTSTIELAAYKNHRQTLARRVPTPTHCYHAFKTAIKNLVSGADRVLQDRGAVGIAMPGIISPKTFKSFCTNIPCTNNQNFVADIEFILDRPVKIQNSASCFTLSECTGGPGTAVNTVLGVKLHDGCGCGLITHGCLHKDRDNMAEVWGHTPLPFNLLDFGSQNFPVFKCHCGKDGCFDQYLSARGLERIHQYLCDEKITAAEIISADSDNNPNIQKTTDIFYRILAFSLVNMINTLDPDMIILGGIITKDDLLLKKLPGLLCEYSLPSSRLPDICTSVYGESSTVRGAALLNA